MAYTIEQALDEAYKIIIENAKSIDYIFEGN